VPGARVELQQRGAFAASRIAETGLDDQAVGEQLFHHPGDGCPGQARSIGQVDPSDRAAGPDQVEDCAVCLLRGRTLQNLRHITLPQPHFNTQGKKVGYLDLKLY
jgi:hypothetical protein